jgi:hypothetical protein
VKDNVLQSHGTCKEVTKDITWLNNTLRHQSELYLQIRQLEYSLLLAVQHISELFSSVQYALLGKLPISLVSQVTLHRVLTNISLHLPKNYEFVAGIRRQDIHLYYELVKVSLVGKARVILLVMSDPLKTAAQFFTPYRTVVLPSRLSYDTFITYQLDYFYFGLAVDRTLITEADF